MEVVHLGSCSVLKLGVDRNVDLDKEGLVVVMYVGVCLLIGLHNNIGVVVGKSVVQTVKSPKGLSGNIGPREVPRVIRLS